MINYCFLVVCTHQQYELLHGLVVNVIQLLSRLVLSIIDQIYELVV